MIVEETDKKWNRRKYAGLMLIFLTAAIWIVTSYISGSLVSSDGEHAAAVHPFLLTYLATSLFTLYLPLIHLQTWYVEFIESRKKRLTADR
jgi:hypothetical protein